MDYFHLMTVIPTLIAAIAGLFGGVLTAKKILTVACEVVYLLADKELENHEKRAAAVGLLYIRFPKFGALIPAALMGKVVDLAWEDIIKPVATNPNTLTDPIMPATP